jgi:hypothetical protein
MKFIGKSEANTCKKVFTLEKIRPGFPEDYGLKKARTTRSWREIPKSAHRICRLHDQRTDSGGRESDCQGRRRIVVGKLLTGYRYLRTHRNEKGVNVKARLSTYRLPKQSVNVHGPGPKEVAALITHVALFTQVF